MAGLQYLSKLFVVLFQQIENAKSLQRYQNEKVNSAVYRARIPLRRRCLGLQLRTRQLPDHAPRSQRPGLSDEFQAERCAHGYAPRLMLEADHAQTAGENIPASAEQLPYLSLI